MKKEANYYRIRQAIFQIKGELDYIELYAQKQREKLEELDIFLSEQARPAVDLEKIIEQTYHDGSVADTDDIDHVTYENIARHFYELGKNSMIWTR